MSIIGTKQESHTYLTQSLPAQLDSNRSSQTIRTTTRYNQIPPQNGTQTSGGNSFFTIPKANATISRKSIFLRFRVNITTSTAPDYTTLAKSLSFAGAGQLVNVVIPSTGSVQYSSSIAITPSLTNVVVPTFTSAPVSYLNTTIDSNNSTFTTALQTALNTYTTALQTSINTNMSSNIANIVAPVVGINQLSNGYAVIQRLTLKTDDGILEQINHVNDLMDLQLAHATNPEFIKNDAGILLGMGQATYSISASNQYYDVCLPLPLSSFNGVQDFPLHFIKNKNLTLQIDFAPTSRAIVSGATVGATDYNISNMYLCYETIELPKAIVDSMAMKVKQEPYVLPISSYLGVKLTVGAFTNYNIGINASSVKGVYLLPSSLTAYTVASQKTYSRDIAGDAITNWGVGMNAQLYLDGRLVNSIIVDSPSITFAMLKASINNGLNNTRNPSIINEYNYRKNTFAIGLDCSAFSDESTIFTGQPCSTVSVALTGYINNTTNICSLFVNYDSLIIFDGDNIIVKK